MHRLDTSWFLTFAGCCVPHSHDCPCCCSLRLVYLGCLEVSYNMSNSTAKAVTCTGSPRRLTSENRQSPHVINRLVPATSYKHVYTFTCSPQGCLCVGTLVFVIHMQPMTIYSSFIIDIKSPVKRITVSRSRVDIEGLLQYRGDDFHLMRVLLSILLYL